MPNRNLTKEELQQAKDLLEKIRKDLTALSHGDEELLFAFRRKIFKELTYDERNTPTHRSKLKKLKLSQQEGKCDVCQQPLPEKNNVLDRFQAHKGYTPENTRLICEACDRRIQSERRFS